MMADFRALCAELVEFVARLTKHYYEPAELLTRARAALADGPAVSQDREPASVTGQPSDEELLELWHGSDWYNEGATLREFCSIAHAVLARWGNPAPQPAAVTGRPSDEEWDALVERVWDKYQTVGYQGERFMYDGDFGSALDLVRKELSRWGHQPAPPADGEVAELVEWLRVSAAGNDRIGATTAAAQLNRAAELLEQQAPVAVSERLPGPGDCDAEGKCWWGRSESNDWFADWILAPHEVVAEFCQFSAPTVWRPAHALPLPELDE